jgi:hypothetical protein
MAFKKINLIGRNWDFFCCGGLSLVAWAIVFTADHLMPDSRTVRGNLEAFPEFFGLTAFFVTFPHFMASYRLAYREKRLSSFDGSWQLFVVPVILLTLIVFAFLNFSESVTIIPGHDFLSAHLGMKSQLAGKLIFEVLLNIMYLSVGWHYSMQVYGCAVYFARSQAYPMNRNDRFALKLFLVSIWLVNFFAARSGVIERDRLYFGFHYLAITLPVELFVATKILLGLATIWLGYKILRKKWKTGGFFPPAIVAVGPLAFVAWWLPLFRQIDFYLYAVPLFHSLQYLPFVARVWHLTPLGGSSKRIPWLKVGGGLMLVGYLAFKGLPESLDTLFRTQEVYHLSLFLISAHIFINTHHFFLESFTWQKGRSTQRALSALNSRAL